MNELLRSLERPQENTNGIDSILNDSELSPLFTSYLRATGRGTVDPSVASVIEKYTTSKKITPGEIRTLSGHINTFNERLQKAQNVLDNLQDEGISGLSSILEKSIVTLRPGEFPLFIKGIAVRNDSAFEDVVQSVAEWKQGARNRTTERQAAHIKERIDDLRKTMGISKAEINRFLQMPSDTQRVQELKSSIGKLPWLTSLSVFAQGSYIGTDGSAGALNNLIEQYQRTTADVKGGLENVVNAFESIDMTTDNLWSEIPEIVRKKAESLPPDKKPVTLKEAQDSLKPESVNKTYRSHLRNLGADVEAQWNAAQDAYAGRPTDLWNSDVTINGSTKKWSEVRHGFESKPDMESRRRGVVSTLIEILLALFRPAELGKAMDKLPDLK